MKRIMEIVEGSCQRKVQDKVGKIYRNLNACKGSENTEVEREYLVVNKVLGVLTVSNRDKSAT